MLQTNRGTDDGVAALMADIGRRARAAARPLAMAGTAQKDRALEAMADALITRAGTILEANAIDMANGEEAGLKPSFLDRLKLTEERIEGIAQSIRDIAALNDPIGEVIAEWNRPNGLHIERVRKNGRASGRERVETAGDRAR